MEEHFWLGLVHIFMIDLVLSSDNAIVIGMACRGLPKREQTKAVLYGTLLAVLLRIMLTSMTTWMLDIPLVKAVGGMLLLWMACKLIMGEQEEMTEISQNQTVGQAVRTILLADFVMSLDNVLAVGGAAHGDLRLVILGLVMSVPLLMWGSALVARLMNRFHSLVIIGGGLLAFTAVDMFLEDPYVWKWINPFMLNHMWLPFIASLLVMLWGRMKRA
ncbi:membrane protein [Brevibacillus reuszeri]|uniref:Membrane protein n=1 Tax=Brevibacillus reuszeri TaxID=54915 RepID=A0A0K9YTX7_9BACL|nr:TerC family protein [Brevibacillus reuszeri]KNB72169.1 membrane protein [Brevibacillus reuszeri]MED1855798.1 TerC family protein [Brevibacillus reuszeri]GED72236.1 membrane protein [Brevibacillus reuszeri]